VALVVGALVLAVLATMKFLQIRRDIEADVVRFSPTLDIGLAIIVVLAGVVLTTYLVITA
jgi:uncharacterized membrane protein YidH (DUF202 family)